MTTIRIHSYTSTANPPADGTVSCDFRGPLFVGDNEGDHHHTLKEWDVADDDPMVMLTLTEGPAANRLLSKLEGDIIPGVPIPQGEVPRLRVGIWDKQAPGN